METLFTQANVSIASGAFMFCIFLIGFFLAILPIYFMIGTLTRLTDIKYKLDDIIDSINTSNLPINTSPRVENVENNSDFKPEEIKVENDIKNNTTQVFQRLGGEVLALSKPSKSLIITTAIAVICFVLAMIVIYLFL